MARFDATIEFENASKEISLLILYAKRNKRDFLKYGTFNKAAIVLLCSKFEAFIEEFLEEYSYTHIQNSTNKNLDQYIFDHIFFDLLSKLELNKKNLDKRQAHLVKVLQLCGETETEEINEFSVKPKYSYGKHGQKETEKLLKGFGFMEFVDHSDTQNFFRSFNSLTNIRNNIIHEDATPSLTHQDVERFQESIKTFVERINEFASNKLTLILSR